MKAKTKDGFECDLDERRLNDWETVEALERIQESKNDAEAGLAVVTFAKRLLGPEIHKELIAFAKEKNDGFAPTDYVSDSLFELMNSAQETKN